MALELPPPQIGQFDDPIEIKTQDDGPRIDELVDEPVDEHSLDWSESDNSSTSDEENAYNYELAVDDEDWDIAERDFTKHYNRLKQHILVQGGSEKATLLNSSSTSQAKSSTKPDKTLAPLPAINAPVLKPSHQRHLQLLTSLTKYSAKLANLDTPYYRAGVNPKGPSSTANTKDKADRATTEQVLDPRTRVILYKMIGRGLVGEMNGCVSTGKEANVYHALTPLNPDDPSVRQEHLALKIYKTSTLQFTNRSHYIEGEYRFKRGYSSSRNPRKLIRLWAEKEMRNLKRLFAAGIPCPEPLEVRENVLVMRFVGDAEGWPAPRLKDASIPMENLPQLYLSLLKTVRKLYQQCHLVHADLSEYNILYLPQQDEHNSKTEAQLFIIDVSQSVEHDHPMAFDFLRKDLTNVERFFETAGVRCVGLRKAFEYVIQDRDFSDEELKFGLDTAVRETEDGDTEDEPRKFEEAIFAKSFIPRKLDEVYDPERDIELMNKEQSGHDSKGHGDGLIYHETGVIGLVRQDLKSDLPEENDAEDDVMSEEDDDDASAVSGERQPRGHRHEDRESKKERKKAVKGSQQERRRNKIERKKAAAQSGRGKGSKR